MFFNLLGRFFILKVGTFNLICEIIFLFFIFKVFFEDLSIKQANPNNLALDFFISFTHSKLDFPVVITSSTIRTFDFFLIEKPLLNLNLPLTLSQKTCFFS